MKFGDKLYELRKRKGYSQEELAEKLGVSRQSVSKWESNSTYPETDKIIQLANLFDCSMDDLINDKITDTDSIMRNNKNKNIEKVWNSFLNFITDSINMFSKMSFAQGFKCFIELLLIVIGLVFLGDLICGTISAIIVNAISFMKNDFVVVTKHILEGVLSLIWFIISLIVIIHVFKIRYLYPYEIEKGKDENEGISNQKSAHESIREESEKTVAFLEYFAKFVVFFIKLFSAVFLIWFVVITLVCIVLGIFSIVNISTNLVFLWFSILFILGAVVAIQFIILIISFMFDKKINFIPHLITFISCIVLAGISIAMTTISFKNFDYIRDNSVFKMEDRVINIDYKDDLVIKSSGIGQIKKYQYVIDNSMDDGKIMVSKKVDKKYFDIKTIDGEDDKLPVIKINQDYIGGEMALFNFFKNNLKKNRIVVLDNYGDDPLIIKANENTINNLLINLKKIYLIEENRVDNIINVEIHQSRVYFKNGLAGEYDARDDSIKYTSDNYSCKKEIEATSLGERYIYDCNYIEKD